MGTPRIERLWALKRAEDGARAIAAVVPREMRNAEHDQDAGPLRGLLRIFLPDGTTAEKWSPHDTRDEAIASLNAEKPEMLAAGWEEVAIDLF